MGTKEILKECLEERIYIQDLLKTLNINEEFLTDLFYYQTSP